MRRHIIAAIVAVTTLAVVLFGVPLAVVIRSLYLTDARTRLEREATLATRDIPNDFATATDPIDLSNGTGDIKLALYAPTGTRISGDGPAQGDTSVLEAAQNKIHAQAVGDHLIAAVPVAVNEAVIAVVRAETPTTGPERHAHLAWTLMAALGLAIIGAATATATVLANRMTRPLQRVREAATRLGHGDFTIVVPPAGVPELDDVGQALTSTAQRLGHAMQRERDFSTHASHQLRTPIAGLRLTVENELITPRPDPTDALHEVLTVADRLESTVTDLLRLAREPVRSEELDLDQLIEHARTWHGTLAAQGRRLVLPGHLPAPGVTASTAAVTQALDVLLDNATLHGASTVTVTCATVHGGIALSVTDEGHTAHRPPTTTGTRPDGHGIGLTLASTLIEAEGGRIQRPQPGRPSTYTIMLPATSRSDQTGR